VVIPNSQSLTGALQPPTSALVTGATGMLGRHLVELLLQQGVTVRAFARPGSDVSHLRAAGVDLVYGNAGDVEAIRRAVEGTDILFHFAAYLTVSAPFGAAGDSPLYQSVNVDFTEHLLSAARESGLSRFIFASSNSVYALDAPVPTPEDAPLQPLSAYGRSKVAAEAHVRDYQQRGLATTIVRPCVIYGPGDRYFIPTALSLARLPLLPLVNGGETLFDMVYARDVASLLWRAACSAQAIGRIYNAGPGQPTTLRQLVEAYRRLTARGPKIVSIAPAAARRFGVFGRPLVSRLAPGAEAALTPEGLALMAHDMHLDMSRAAQDLDYRPQTSLEEGLRRTLLEAAPQLLNS